MRPWWERSSSAPRRRKPASRAPSWLWRSGPRYRPWALFATAVIAVSFLSGTVTSFARQALFAFPLYWAVADGPRQLRHPLVAVVAVAANVAFALTLAKYAP